MGRTVVHGGKKARLSSFRDLTRQKEVERTRRRFEERLQRTQKLEDLGVIAGGVAHDFNNLLLVILGHAELALTHAGPLLAEHLRKIQAAAQAAGELTAQMLTFAGRGAVEREAVELGKVVREVLALCHGALGDLQVDTGQIAGDLPTVFADSAQVRQLIMNLVVNAVEALTDQSEGLAISVREVERTTEELRELTVDASKGAGRFVELQVRDEGCGMDAETMARIFDPFFSTKFQGRGLGLASVLGIVRGHAGALDVESTVGQGTRFTLLFPLAGR
jgi:signal transduction histidine kinase